MRKSSHILVSKVRVVERRAGAREKVTHCGNKNGSYNIISRPSGDHKRVTFLFNRPVRGSEWAIYYDRITKSEMIEAALRLKRKKRIPRSPTGAFVYRDIQEEETKRGIFTFANRGFTIADADKISVYCIL